MHNIITFVFLKSVIFLFFLSCNSESKIAGYIPEQNSANIQCNLRANKNSCDAVGAQKSNTKITTSPCKEEQVLVDGECVVNEKSNSDSEDSTNSSTDDNLENKINSQVGTCKSETQKNALNLKKKPIYAILLAGQSNMAGSGSISVLKRLLCAGGIKHESITDCANLSPTSDNIFKTLHDAYLTEKDVTLGEGNLNVLRSSYNQEADYSIRFRI